jgi:hypothetical protein
VKVNFNGELLKLDKLCVVPLEVNLKVYENVKKTEPRKSPLKSKYIFLNMI